MYLSKKYGKAELLCDPSGAGEKWRVLVQKVSPVACILRQGGLVGKKTGYQTAFFSTNQIAHHITHGGDFIAFVGTYQAQHVIKGPASQRLINHIDRLVQLQAQGLPRPFPVAIMGGEDDRPLPGLFQCPETFIFYYGASLDQLFPGNSKGLNGFQYQVGQMPVKLPCRTLDLTVVVFREGIAQVVQNHFFAVAGKVENKAVKGFR